MNPDRLMLLTEIARLRSALGRARKFIKHKGPAGQDKRIALEKIDAALASGPLPPAGRP